VFVHVRQADGHAFPIPSP